MPLTSPGSNLSENFGQYWRMNTTKAPAQKAVSFVAPFRSTAFTVIWTASLVSNIGAWMYNAASGWLMTSLNPIR